MTKKLVSHINGCLKKVLGGYLRSVGCISAFRHKRYMCKHGLDDVLGRHMFKMKLDSEMRSFRRSSLGD